MLVSPCLSRDGQAVRASPRSEERRARPTHAAAGPWSVAP